MKKEEIALLLSEGEGYNLEFKESLSDTIAKDICAFANANGGKIFLGISDKGELKGIEITNKLKSQIQDYARNIVPSLTLQIESIDTILVITVPEGKCKPYSSSGRFYLRQGANSQQLDRDEVRDLFKDEGFLRFDELPNKKFEIKSDLSKPAFNIFIKKANISRLAPMDKILGSLQAYESGKMRNAGVLMFCKEILRFFPTAAIACTVYMGNDKYKILDRKEFGRDIVSNFEDAMSYIQSRLNTEYIIKGGRRTSWLELPEDAIREALLNAIAHKDYFVSSYVQVDIYLDRVEISNPGGIIGSLTVEDLYGTSVQRNPLLFGLMQRIELVEKSGSGLLRIRKEMKDYRLDSPVIKADKRWFRMIFLRPDLQNQSYEERVYGAAKNEPTNEPTNEPIKLTLIQKRILEEIKEAPYLTYEEIASILRKSRITVMRNIGVLKNKKLIKRIGPNKGGHWEVRG